MFPQKGMFSSILLFYIDSQFMFFERIFPKIQTKIVYEMTNADIGKSYDLHHKIHFEIKWLYHKRVYQRLLIFVSQEAFQTTRTSIT